jgi:Cdc6-like AAA superfamily ATPase
MIWKRKSQTTVDNPVSEINHAPDETQSTVTLVESFTPAPPSYEGITAGDSLWRERVEVDPAPMLPRFMASAADDMESASADRLARRRLALRDALAASQPVVARDAFAGRHDPMARLINAIEEQRVHVVIYGERGIGKTSLAHVFAETAREARYHVIYASCGTAANFSEMFRSILARIPRIFHSSVLPNSVEAENGDNFDIMLPEGEFGARELADVLSGVVGTRVLIMLDEYDRVVDVNFRRDVAELIKNLSDRAARVQLIITGVALNLDELIGYAPSIRRNITGLPMTPMSKAEMRELLRMGERAADISFGEDAVDTISQMAGGSPYLVRLLGHQAGLLALDSGRERINQADARRAVDLVIRDWQASLPRRVQSNLSRDETKTHWQLLVSAAKAGSSADGWFTVDDVYAEMGGSYSALAIERDLKLFVNTVDLLERREGPGDPHFRFGYPGVASLLMMSAAMAQLVA